MCFKFKKTVENVKTVDDGSDKDHLEELLYSIEIVNEQVDSTDSKKSFVHLVWETRNREKRVKCQLDLGATVNVIGYKNLKEITYECDIKKSKVVINQVVRKL